MAILTRDQIKAAQDVKREEIEIPEWGGAVVVTGVSVKTGLNLLNQMQDESGKIDNEKAMLFAVIYGVTNPKFEESDVEWLKEKSMSALMKVTKAFMRLSGFEESAVAEARKSPDTKPA